MARACDIELSTRTDGADLPPAVPPAWELRAVPRPVDLLDTEAAVAAWRIVEVFSRSGLPFDLELHWSAGSGAGASARITVARAARIAVHARSLRAVATNHASALNRVGVTVADGFAATRNQWEHRGRHLDGGSSTPIPVPAFAQLVRVELAEPSPSAVVRVRDGQGHVRSVYPVAAQPPAGIPVGGAAVVELDAPASADFRAVYQLSI